VIFLQGLFMTLFWIGLLGFVVSLVMVRLSLFKKTGKAKKWSLFLAGSVVVFFVSVAGVEPVEETNATPQNNVTADDVLKAFEDKGLSTPNPRDNTENNCPDLGCTKLITTDVVSIYEWPSEEKAKEVQRNYDFGDYQSGKFIIRFNIKHNADGSIKYQPYPDEQSYKDVLDSLVKNVNAE